MSERRKKRSAVNDCNFYWNKCDVGKWISLDTSDGTGDHENYPKFVYCEFRTDLNFFSDDEIVCLEIRTREIMKKINHTEMSVKLLHRNLKSQKFVWGPSEKYGFHCFNNFGANGQCDDFEWRVFKNCEI